MPVTSVTTISVPEEFLHPVIGQSPTNKFFLVGLIVDNFLKSEQCNAPWIASIPQSKFCPTWSNISVRMNSRNRKQISAWRKVAKVTTPRGSLGSLVTAALYWHATARQSAQKAA